MKKLGIGILALTLVAVIVPVLTQCQAFGRAIVLANGKTVPMKCHWTAEAAIAIAIPLGIVGIMMILGRRKETLLSMSIIGAALGIVTILLPTVLFGVCADNTMLCNSVMKPALILTGTLLAAVSLGGLFISMRRLEPAA